MNKIQFRFNRNVESHVSAPKIIKKTIQNIGNQEKPGGTQTNFDDISLEFEDDKFKAPPVYEENRKLKDLSAFLVEHGTQIKKLVYIDSGFQIMPNADKMYRQLIINHCPNITQVRFEFTEYPDQVDDENSQLMVKFLTPGLTSLETINNVIGLHYLSCMGFVYENFSSKIKLIRTDELKPEELSVLSGDNNKDNPALSLEELIFNDNGFLCSRRVHQSPESLALKPASLTDLVKLVNLRRIDLPFLLTKEKIQPVTALPLLTYASIRLLSSKRGKPSSSSFTENIGRALANVTELKLCDLDPGLMVLNSILKNCNKLEKLDLTELHVSDDYNMGIALLAGIEHKFKQLNAKIRYSHSNQIHLILHLINNVTSLTKITIIDVENEETMEKVIAASISLARRIQHELELDLKWCRSSSEQRQNKLSSELTANKPDNLKITINISDYKQYF